MDNSALSILNLRRIAGNVFLFLGRKEKLYDGFTFAVSLASSSALSLVE